MLHTRLKNPLLMGGPSAGFRPENAHLEALLVGIEKKLPSLSAQHISNIVMALGKMEFPAPSFLAAVAAEAKPKLGQFNPQALSNTVSPAQ